ASYTVTANPSAGITLDAANAGAAIARDQCVTISLGSGAASECGDLRVVHALPTVRTLNSDRAPVLLYNSGSALPFPIITGDVTLPAGQQATAVTTAINADGEDPLVTGTWDGAAWGSSGATRRIVAIAAPGPAPTGVYPFTVTVTPQYAAGGGTAYQATDTLIIVDRLLSPFGAGWWVAGWEQLYFPSDTTTRLWVGGDGSARIYRKAHDSVYVATRILNRSDSIAWSPGAGRYIRWGANKLQVRFDTTG